MGDYSESIVRWALDGPNIIIPAKANQRELQGKGSQMLCMFHSRITERRRIGEHSEDAS